MSGAWFSRPIYSYRTFVTDGAPLGFAIGQTEVDVFARESVWGGPGLDGVPSCRDVRGCWYVPRFPPSPYAFGRYDCFCGAGGDMHNQCSADEDAIWYLSGFRPISVLGCILGRIARLPLFVLSPFFAGWSLTKVYLPGVFSVSDILL